MSKILEQVNEVLKGNPLIYAIIVINMIFLLFIWRINTEIAANAARQDAMLEKCISR